MTAQDRINQLAQAALRSAPPAGSAPKPATYMPTFEQMRSEQFVEKPTAAASNPAVAAPAPAAVPAPAAAVVKDAKESDKDLTSLLDQRDEVKGKKLRRTSMAVTCTLLALCTGAGAFVTFNPTAKRKMDTVVTAFQQSGKDLKSLTSIMDTYEKQLDKVAVQGARIDAATMALGVDPNTDTSSQDVSIDSAMKGMSGGEAGGTAVSERDAALKAKFGVVGKLAKDMAPETQKAEADVQF